MTRADLGIFGAVLIAAGVITVATYGWTQNSIVWLLVLLVLMLAIENLPNVAGRWRFVRISAFLGLVAGWTIVFFWMRGS